MYDVYCSQLRYVRKLKQKNYNRMELNNKQTILVSALALASAGFALAVKYARRMNKRYEHYQQQQLKNLSDVINERNKKDLLVKFQITNSPSIQVIQPIYANQKSFLQPSAIPAIKTASQMFQKNLKYSSEISDVSKNRYKIEISNFGTILSDIYTVDRQFREKELGFFGKIHYCLSYCTQWFLDLFQNKKAMAENQNRKPQVSGPYIGYIVSTIGLITNIPLVFSCSIDDHGNIIPQFTAATKQLILQQIYALKLGSNILAFITGLLVLMLGKYCFPIFEKIISKYIYHIKNKPYQLYNPRQIEDNQKCIVCMDNARNVIFFNCKHLIICNECVNVLADRKCPYCTQTIEHIKLLNSI